MFAQFALHERLLKAVAELKFVEPTPVQKIAIPAALSGRDLRVTAQTGSGKTAAFVLPMLNRLMGESKPRADIRALILLTVLPKQMASVVEALRAMPEVRSLQSVSGPWDLVAVAVVPTIGEMDELTDRIGVVPGVERTTSSLVLSTKFER